MTAKAIRSTKVNSKPRTPQSEPMPSPATFLDKLPAWGHLVSYDRICCLIESHPTTTLADICQELGRPNESRFRQWLRGFEARFRDFPGGDKLIDRNPSGVHGLTAKGQQVRKMVKEILQSVQTEINCLITPRHANKLRVAASEAVLNYLFPLVLPRLLTRWRGRQVRFIPRMFRPNKIETDVPRRTDFAIAWTGYSDKYEKAYDAGRIVTVLPLDDSTAPVHVIFSPSHPLAEWVQHNPHYSAPDLLTELRNHVVIHPDLYQLREIARRLTAADQCMQVIGLPAVLNHVRLTLGIGLFPGWRWLLHQLEHEFHLRTLELPPDAANGTEQTMRLCAILPQGGRGSLTAEGRELLHAIEEELRTKRLTAELCWQTAAGPALPADQTRGKELSLRVYYINTGPYDDHPVPHWRQGGLMLRKAGKNRYKGTLFLTPRSRLKHSHAHTSAERKPKKPRQIEIVITAERDLLIMRGWDPEKKRWGVASFCRRVQKDGQLASEFFLIGVIHFEGRRTTGAPILLTNAHKPLTAADYYQLELLTSFLAHAEDTPDGSDPTI